MLKVTDIYGYKFYFFSSISYVEKILILIKSNTSVFSFKLVFVSFPTLGHEKSFLLEELRFTFHN